MCASGPRFVKSFSLTLFLTLLITSAFSVNAQNRLGVIRIIVADETEKPMPGVAVELKLKGSVTATATTNEKGEAEFKSLAPGTYEVAVSKESFETLTQSDVVLATAPVEIKFNMVPKIELKDTVTVKAGSEAPIEKGSSPANQLQRGRNQEHSDQAGDGEGYAAACSGRRAFD